ncbi:MAG: hypothetical protein AB7U18_18890 [Dehalococcoidia bacterium]
MQTSYSVPPAGGRHVATLLRRRFNRRSGFRNAGLLAIAALLVSSAACGDGDDDDEDEEEDD